jgi:SRSO17 transposase
LRQLALVSADQVQPVTRRQGTRATSNNPAAAMTSCFLAVRVRPANRDIPRADDGSLPECWLLAEWPPEADQPADYWLSNLPADTPIVQLVRLGHFEGRSFAGWHRHVTLAALAQALCTMLRLDPKVPAPG